MDTSDVERPRTGERVPTDETVPTLQGETEEGEGEAQAAEHDPTDGPQLEEFDRAPSASGETASSIDEDSPDALADQEEAVAGGPGPPGAQDGLDAPAGETGTAADAGVPEVADPAVRAALAAPSAPPPMRPAGRQRGARRGRAPAPLRGVRNYRPLGYVLLALVTVACVALSAALVMKMRAEQAAAAREAANYRYTPPPAPTRTPPVVTVIGDTSTFGAGGRSAASSEWPALVGSTLKATVVTLPGPGSGYVTPSTNGGGTFVTQAAKVPTNSRVVVFFGGRSDQGATSLALATAVTKAVASAASRAPNASILVVGPTSPSPLPPASLLSVRDTLRSAAAASKVDWVDPIAQKWLIGGAGLIGSGGYPTKEGEQALERDFRSVLNGYL